MATTFLTDLANEATTLSLINPDSYTSTQTGTGVDCQLIEGPISAILQIKSRSDNTSTLSVALQEAKEDPNNLGNPLVSDYTALQTPANGGVFTAVTTNLSAQVQVLTNAYRTKRFIRAVATMTGGSPTDKYGVLLLGRSKISTAGNGAQL